MNTKELRAAAERLVKFLRDEWGERADTELLTRELIAVLNAYLAEHPADENAPVSAEWVAALPGWYATFLPGESPSYGFFISGGCYCDGSRDGLRLIWRADTRCAELYDPNDNGLALPCETRGRLRRLCAALGRPLTEPTP